MRPILLIACVWAGASPLLAQTTDAGDPIRCWWRTSAGAVAVGETFEATLTCAAREQDAVRTVADESRLTAAALQLTPFEVLGGSHPPDVRSASHRFFQYHYTLRVIDRDVIGRDAKFPDLQIGYRVHTRVNGEWVEGRDRAYIMPGRSVRVLSTVPLEADDIRDSGEESFALIETLRFRSRALRIAAVAFAIVGALVAVPAVARLVRQPRPSDGVEKGPSRRSLINAAENELSAIGKESRGGWTPDLAARALHASRLAAAVALKRDTPSRAASEPPAAGQLAVMDGLIRRRPMTVSSSVTPGDVERAIAMLPLTTPHDRRQSLEQLLQAMNVFTRRIYGASFDEGDSPLDDAFTAALAATRGLRQWK